MRRTCGPDPSTGTHLLRVQLELVQLNDPVINAKMERAATIMDPAARAQAWADIDRLVTEQAPVVPWLWDKLPLIRSLNVAGVADQFTAEWSLTFTSLSAPGR